MANLEELRKDDEFRKPYEQEIERFSRIRRELIKRLITKTVEARPEVVRGKILDSLTDNEDSEND